MHLILPEAENADRWRSYFPPRSAPVFRLQSAISGKHLRLSDIQAEKTILAFIPGVWAPWCRKFLSELNQHVEEIYKTGSNIAVIVSQDYEQLAQYTENVPLDIEILSDPHGVINTRYGVFDDVIEEPMKISKPSIFILDDEKNLHFKFIGLHLMDRPTAAEIIEKASVELPKVKEPNKWWLSFKKLFYAGN